MDDFILQKMESGTIQAMHLPFRVDGRKALVTGGASSSILLITYVLVGLAAVFGLVITLYTRLRTRPSLSTDAASRPSLRADDSGQHPNDDDQDVGEERQD